MLIKNDRQIKVLLCLAKTKKLLFHQSGNSLFPLISSVVSRGIQSFVSLCLSAQQCTLPLPFSPNTIMSQRVENQQVQILPLQAMICRFFPTCCLTTGSVKILWTEIWSNMVLTTLWEPKVFVNNKVAEHQHCRAPSCLVLIWFSFGTSFGPVQ